MKLKRNFSVQFFLSLEHYNDKTLLDFSSFSDKYFKLNYMFYSRITSEQSIVAFPSPQSNASVNSTPLLSSCSSVKPMPLMSIGNNTLAF